MKILLTSFLILSSVLIYAQKSVKKNPKPISINRSETQDNNMRTYTDVRDGNIYNIINIGDQIWMSQNLNYTISDSWCYDEKDKRCNNFGRLYTYEAALHACPDGWHLPSDEEWQSLASELEKKNSENSLSLEEKKNGFNTNLAGWRSKSGNFYNLNEIGFYWSSENTNNELACYRYVYSLRNDFIKNFQHSQMAFSVRCIKD